MSKLNVLVLQESSLLASSILKQDTGVVIDIESSLDVEPMQ